MQRDVQEDRWREGNLESDAFPNLIDALITIASHSSSKPTSRPSNINCALPPLFPMPVLSPLSRSHPPSVPYRPLECSRRLHEYRRLTPANFEVGGIVCVRSAYATPYGN